MHRACLVEIAKNYLARSPRADPSERRSPIRGVRRERHAIEPGEGLWASAASAPRRSHLRARCRRSTVGLLTVMIARPRRASSPRQLAARLKIVNGEITEASTSSRPSKGRSARAPRGTASRSRQRRCRKPAHAARGASAIAASYYDALVSSTAPRAVRRRCERQENGFITAAPDFRARLVDSVDTSGRSPPPVRATASAK